MSDFEVKVQKIFVRDHKNADKLELANIGHPDGWQVVIAKGRFETGDLVAYIGENAVVPDDILKQYGYWNEEKGIGMLAGSKGNRVKPMRLRDEFSLGIVLPVTPWSPGDTDTFIARLDSTPPWIKANEGDDVADYLGVTKYNPPVPTCMAGEVCNLNGYTLNFDIENWKKYPTLIKDDEEVIFTEKLHGTWCAMGIVPGLNHPEIDEGQFVVTSKGLSQQGLAFKFNEQNANNVYLRMFWEVKDKIKKLQEWFKEPVYVLGEVFGPIQDLTYGFTLPQFRVFDIFVGLPGKGGRYQDMVTVLDMCDWAGFTPVPVLYHGPFSIAQMRLSTDGKETVTGKQVHLREGIVMNVIPERYEHSLGGRLVLKSVSEAYLTRKNKNATEFN